MRCVYERPRCKLMHGNSLDISLPDGSVDAVVTDPPYELGFMGKKWDANGIAYSVDLWRTVLRVLKPGGHLLAFGGTRTYHRMACAIEDAGFEIRDSLHWIYGTGFPKSLNVSKAIDEALGATRPIVGTKLGRPGYRAGEQVPSTVLSDGSLNNGDAKLEITAAGSPEAAAWEGWGTGLKPAHEPIVLARKPLVGTVAKNVLEFGTGAINLDGCRIASDDLYPVVQGGKDGGGFDVGSSDGTRRDIFEPHDAGRHPANVILSETAAADLDASQPASKSRRGKPRASKAPGDGWGMTATGAEHDDEGGPSRFFYVAKPNRKERDAGCDDLPAKTGGEATDREDDSIGTQNPRAGAGRTGGARNWHPTVKPVTLMRYLVRLVTPAGGVVLDPFTGSGSTGVAALAEGASFIGVELTAEYLPIIEARLRHALDINASQQELFP